MPGASPDVVSDGKPANIADPQSDPRFNKEIDLRPGTRRAAFLAMRSSPKDGSCIG